MTFCDLRLILGFWILRGTFLVWFFSFENFKSSFGISGVCFLTFSNLRHFWWSKGGVQNGDREEVGVGVGKLFLNCQISTVSQLVTMTQQSKFTDYKKLFAFKFWVELYNCENHCKVCCPISLKHPLSRETVSKIHQIPLWKQVAGVEQIS